MSGWWSNQYNDIKGNLKWAILLGLYTIGVHYGKKMLYLIPNIPDWLVWVVIIVVCTVAFVFVATIHPPPHTAQISSLPQVAAGVTDSAQYANVDDFYKTYDNSLLADTEKNVRAQSGRYAPGIDRENFLIRLLSTVTIVAFFEWTWQSIFRSQLLGLEAVNKQPMRIEGLRPFYNNALNPQGSFPFVNYPFTSWLSFLIDDYII
jgi:hypothetical protein